MSEQAQDLPGSVWQVAEAFEPSLSVSLAARLQGWRWAGNDAGQTAATVARWRCTGRTDLFLKHAAGDAAAALLAEADRLRWLGEVMADLVPRLEHFECVGDEAWLLTAAVPGRSAYAWLEAEPDRAPAIVRGLAAFLRRLHALPVDTCPFNARPALRLALARQRLDAGLVDADDFDEARAGQSAEALWAHLASLQPFSEDLVLTHGDFSLDNVLLDERHEVTGVIDLGRLGVADRYQDLAILLNCLDDPDLAETLPPGAAASLQRDFLAAYGIASPDARKLEFHLCLDEFF